MTADDIAEAPAIEDFAGAGLLQVQGGMGRGCAQAMAPARTGTGAGAAIGDQAVLAGAHLETQRAGMAVAGERRGRRRTDIDDDKGAEVVEARESGMGLIGMKAARHLAGLPFLGWWNKPDAFDEHYDEKLLAAPLSPFQRSYAYVLAHGLDVVNADMQSLAQLRENVVAATTSQSYFA